MKPKTAKPIPKRMSPETRRQQMLDAAIDYFAEAGFAVQTRELSRRLGVSQPLLYRYFPSKAALIDAVLEAVFLRQQSEGWLFQLQDRKVPIRDRLIHFYGNYVEGTYTQKWLRIYFFASLANFDFNADYVKGVVQDRILTTVCIELRHSLLSPAKRKRLPDTVTPREIELAWMLQSNLFYGMVRKHLMGSPPTITGFQRLLDAVDLFIHGAQTVYPSLFASSGKAEKRP